MGKCQLYLAVVMVLLSSAFYNSLIEPVSTVVNYKSKPVEVTKGGKLLNSTGSLIETGFARQPLKDINEEDLAPFLGLKQLGFLRYKKWDFFDIITDKFQLLVHFANFGYAGNVQILLYVYEGDYMTYVSDTLQFYQLSSMPALNVNSMRYEGDYKYQSDTAKISIKQTPNAVSGSHHIDVEIETSKFSSKAKLVKKASGDELVMLTPISEDKTHFYYNTKSYGLSAEGQVTVKETEKTFKFDGKTGLGGRDIGRGVWDYNSFWFWAHGQGFITDEKGNKIPFGIDLGNGFEHESTQTYEDCVILGGRLHKLLVVKRVIDEDDAKQNWTLSTHKQNVPGSLQATFVPSKRTTKDENFLVIQAKFKQFFGVYKGHFIDENGKKIEFDNIYGFAEVNRAKW